MELPIILAIIISVFFGIIAIIYTYKEDKLKHRLKTEKDRIPSFVNSLEDGILIVNSNSQITLVNAKAKEILGISDHPNLIDLLSSLPNNCNFAEKIKTAISENKKFDERELKHNDKLMNITISPIINPHQKPSPRITGVLLTIHDATVKKTVNKMKEDLTNIIIHELRSPLTSIKASSEMLTNQNSNLTDEEKSRLLSIINTQTTKMLDEVSMVLDAAKIESGLFTIQKSQSDINKIIEETVAPFKTTAQEKMINFVVKIQPGLPQVNIDSYHISRAIANLLMNSFKFTSGNGTITLEAFGSPQSINFIISDNGSGIPQESQHLLFTKFTQIKSPNASAGKGLGLYVTKGIIEAHGGRISLVSEPEKGTTISFSIPITPAIQSIPIRQPNNRVVN